MSDIQALYQIVVGYDFSDSALLALNRAIGLAATEPNHVLHIINVLDDRSDIRATAKKGNLGYEDTEDVQDILTRELETRLREIDPEHEIHFFIHVRLGKPVDEILRLAAEVGAHLLLVGSHGRTGLKRLLMGSVSEMVVREAKCPVLVVRKREYEDVTLTAVVDAPADHAEKDPYVKPHRYSYSNQMMSRQTSSWPWY